MKNLKRKRIEPQSKDDNTRGTTLRRRGLAVRTNIHAGPGIEDEDFD